MECRLKEAANFSRRHPEGVFQFGSNRGGVGTKSVIGGAQSLRRLLGMSRLNAFLTTSTGTYWNSEFSDDRYDRLDIGLVLAMDDDILKLAVAVRTSNRGNINYAIDTLGLWL